MSSRRAIACTICAKAKTKCDKLTPSCSRCTAKGLQCEPRSTRRTSDNTYRHPRKHMVSPKRYPTTNSIPTLSRHSSPRSVPSSNRHQLVRATSQMDFHAAAKFAQHRPDFATMSMLTPLQTYTSHIVDGCYSYSSSPEQNMAAFSQPMDKNSYLNSGRLTPQTPESIVYNEPVSIMDPFDQYLHQPWAEETQPIGLGFGNEIPGLMQSEPDMQIWSTPEPDNIATSMGHMNAFESPLCDSPASMNAWPSSSVSVSPPQLPHTRAVPSLSISECSVQDFDPSPNVKQDEWSGYMGRPNTSAPYFDSIKAIPSPPQCSWDENMLVRTSTY